MKSSAPCSDNQTKAAPKTKYLHVEIPEELFKQAKIHALQAGMKWTEYICSILKSATDPPHLQHEELPEQ